MTLFQSKNRYARASLGSLMAAVSLCLSAISVEAVEIGEPIINTAQANFTFDGQALAANSNQLNIIKDVKRTDAILSTLQMRPNAANSNIDDINQSCINSTGQTFNRTEFSHPYGKAVTGVESPLETYSTDDALLAKESDSYRSGEPIFLQLIDADQNLHTQIIETVVVTVTANSGDEETVILYEESSNSSKFMGMLQTTTDATRQNDCLLSTATNENVNFDYVDTADDSDTELATTLVDPFGIVYDSLSGQPISSATVTLYRVLEDGSLEPATVFADDGMTPWPSTVTSGGEVIAGEFVEQFPEGGFRFPLIAEGNYIIKVTSPELIDGASALPFSDAIEVNGITYAPLEDGSYELPFEVIIGPPIRLDIPKDSIISPGNLTDLYIEKVATQEYAGIGDFVKYEIKVGNLNPLIQKEAVIVRDTLPQGMRLIESSLKFIEPEDGEISAEIANNGRVINVSVGDIAQESEIAFTYVTQIVANANAKALVNQAFARDKYGDQSKPTSATVYFIDDLQQHTNQLIGQVVLNQCDAIDAYPRDAFKTLSDADSKLALEIDAFFQSFEKEQAINSIKFKQLFLAEEQDEEHDFIHAVLKHVKHKYEFPLDIEFGFDAKEGMYHQTRFNTVEIELIGAQRSKTKRIYYDAIYQDIEMIDLSGIRVFLEDGRYTLTDVDGRYHFDGVNNDSHVVQLDTDSLPENMEMKSCDNDTRFAGRNFSQFVDLSGGSLWRADFYVEQFASTSAEEQSADSSSPDHPSVDNYPTYENIQPKLAFIKPSQSHLALPFLDLVISSPSAASLKLYLNQEPVNAVYKTRGFVNDDKTAKVSTWSGVPIQSGRNIIRVDQVQPDGSIIDSATTEVFYNSEISKIELVKEKSHLVADGRTPPVVAVRFMDNQNHPAHKDLQGKFSVQAPHQAYFDDQLEQRNLLLRDSTQNQYRIEDDGIAYIRLQPTQQSGEVNLDFIIQERRETISAWLSSEQRDWILVGIAEGTVGYQTIDDHAEALDEDESKEGYYDEGRLAFYAKGKVKGEWLITAAFDSAKQDQGKLQRELVDPTLYFTLFGDASQTYQDALSSEKFYLKIEKEQFYALFGDFSTGFTETELSRYQRRFTGVKSEFQTEDTQGNLFAANEKFHFVKDELKGESRSGPYQLSQTNIIINSEQIVLETRKRFNELEVVERQTLNRFVDYDIDYREGTLLFKQPIQTADENFNPIYIVADYELDKQAEGDITFGGQFQHQITEKVRVGITGVNQSQTEQEMSLVGLNANVAINESSELTLEAAQSEHKAGDSAGSAFARYDYRGESVDAEVTYRNYDTDFGIGQQNEQQSNIQQIAAQADIDLSEHWSALTYAQKEWNDESDSYQNYEGSVQYSNQIGTELYGFNIGSRISDSQAQESNYNQQLTAGVFSTFFQQKVRLALQSEQALLGDNTANDRYWGNLEYQVSEATSIYYSHELMMDEAHKQFQQFGIKSSPWENAQMHSYLSNEKTREEPHRLYSHLGLVQNLPINERLYVSFGIDRAQAMESTEFPNNPLTASAVESYTAASVGSNYQHDDWSINNQLEYRNSDDSERYGARLNWYRPENEGYVYGFRIQGFETREQKRDFTDQQLQSELSLAYRPDIFNWSILERFRVVFDRTKEGSSSLLGQKFINHLRSNYKPDIDHELSLGYSVKYNQQQFDELRLDSWSHFVSTEYRYDFKPFSQRKMMMDAGLRAATLLSGDTTLYSFGPTIGANLSDNIWLSIGYNFDGFTDSDFAAASYTSFGPWMTFRIKLDQKSFSDSE